jgi:hypothetical protein
MPNRVTFKDSPSHHNAAVYIDRRYAGAIIPAYTDAVGTIRGYFWLSSPWSYPDHDLNVGPELPSINDNKEMLEQHYG